MKLLSKLAVEGFRGMHDLKIDHLSQVNLIVGDNNCGKKACWNTVPAFKRKHREHLQDSTAA